MKIFFFMDSCLLFLFIMFSSMRQISAWNDSQLIHIHFCQHSGIVRGLYEWMRDQGVVG